MSRRLLVLVFALMSACSPRQPDLPVPMRDLPGLPFADLDDEQQRTFDQGDELFDLALRPYDGLGPLYTRSACSQCHEEDARGPGTVTKMVLVESDGVTPRADQSALAYGHTARPLTEAGATTPIAPPSGLTGLKLSYRLGPSVLGRGYVEAISDADIRAEAQAQTGGPVSGRVNEVRYASEPNEDTRFHRHTKGERVVGRFGLKARIATLDDFTADALLGDMGITSPLRPVELPNPDMLVDDLKPGVDVTFTSVNARADYLRLVSTPPRQAHATGQAAFEKAQCGACHKSDWTTRSDWPIPQLAGVAAPIYSDLLLHDMGDGLADSMVNEDGEAGPREWRTTPLIGVRFNRTLMHDGRAKTVEEAIAAHRSSGSEANASVDAFDQLPAGERQALLEFAKTL